MARQQAPERSRPEILQAEDIEYRKCMGRLEAIVRLQGDRYWFSVRDVTREEFTIHGFGVDFQEAVTAVEQLMELLKEQPRRLQDVTEDAVPSGARAKKAV